LLSGCTTVGAGFVVLLAVAMHIVLW
jgi:hypothetical protein